MQTESNVAIKKMKKLIDLAYKDISAECYTCKNYDKNTGYCLIGKDERRESPFFECWCWQHEDLLEEVKQFL